MNAWQILIKQSLLVYLSRNKKNTNLGSVYFSEMHKFGIKVRHLFGNNLFKIYSKSSFRKSDFISLCYFINHSCKPATLRNLIDSCTNFLNLQIICYKLNNSYKFRNNVRTKNRKGKRKGEPKSFSALLNDLQEPFKKNGRPGKEDHVIV